MERDEMIKECKRIIAEWGSVNSAERELDCSPCVRSVGSGKQNVSDLIESFNADSVEVVVYNDEIEISSYDLKYEELDDDILHEVYEILKIYDMDMEKQNSKIIKGKFTSIWDNGTVTTPATLNTKTGEISTESVDVSDDLGTLMEEWFEDEEGEEYDVCPECHEYTLHTCMEPDEYVSHQLNELKRCKGPNCDYFRFVR